MFFSVITSMGIYVLQVPLYTHCCSQGQNATLEDHTHFTHTWKSTPSSLLATMARSYFCLCVSEADVHSGANGGIHSLAGY